jgi:predicted CXXCH cytochrome family protein
MKQASANTSINKGASNMKKTTLVVALAIVLTLVFATSAFATTGKFFAGGVNYYKWTTPTSVTFNGVTSTAVIKSGVSTVGVNSLNPGVHANYLANTAKCGICHSVHRAAGNGNMLLPQADTSCAGCHTAGTAVTTKIITWTPAPVDWTPVTSLVASMPGSAWWAAATPKQRLAASINTTASGGAFARDHDISLADAQSQGGLSSRYSAGGPHNDSLADMIGDGFWDGTGTPPLPTYEGYRYGCATRRCHLESPHGVGSSKYKLFAAKLLFNGNPAEDGGTFGGLDASIMATTIAGDITINGAAPDAAEKKALVTGLTCGRPSNVHGGEDECHAEASYAIVDKGIKENRNAATGLSSTDYRTDNTQAEVAGFGGNDNRTSKTGHVAGSFEASTTEGSYAPIAGCTSCHDQTDSNNTVDGNFTFPHGQTPTGNTNLKMAAGASADGTTGTGHRSRIWSGWSGGVGADKTVTYSNPAGQKAFDGQCLKCHRDGAGNGIGLTK